MCGLRHVAVQVPCRFASPTQSYELQYPSTVCNSSSAATGGCSQPPSPPGVQEGRGTAARCARGTHPPASVRCGADQRSPLTSTGLPTLVSTRSGQRPSAPFPPVPVSAERSQRPSALPLVSAGQHRCVPSAHRRQACQRWSARSAGQLPTAPGLPAPGSAGAFPALDSADAHQHPPAPSAQHSPAPSPSADQR